MNIESFREYCLSKKGVTESFPFDEHTLVFKVAHKMFALTTLDKPELSVNLKCNPDWAIELREEYENISQGYHMSKKHWNTILLDGTISITFFKELVDHSYDLVVQSLNKKQRKEAGL